ncbi:hypothetical protein BLNAU_14918 [Blattamonas nauphoetae]|uniref:Uncharacterized protein n=1 Tax=Blattamonas nauphoetae TaxID=2049346 RepID=A0ABQ9XDU0_9EUKA|nr:hypothetical protein BLNAU_14918 [Blattamonas nauphoetae]
MCAAFVEIMNLQIKSGIRSPLIAVAEKATAVFTTIAVLEKTDHKGDDHIQFLCVELGRIEEEEKRISSALEMASKTNTPDDLSTEPPTAPTVQHRQNMIRKRFLMNCLANLCNAQSEPLLDRTANLVITAVVVDGLDRSRSFRDSADDAVEVEALRTLSFVLFSLREQLKDVQTRNRLMPTLKAVILDFPEAGQTDSDQDRRQWSYSCLDAAAPSFYSFLSEYADSLIEMTCRTFQRNVDGEVFACLSMWLTLLEAESTLQRDSCTTHDPQPLDSRLSKKAEQHFTEPLISILLSVKPDQDHDDWKHSALVGLFLSELYAQNHSQALFDRFMSFISQNLLVMSNDGQNVMGLSEPAIVPPFTHRWTAISLLGCLTMGIKKESKQLSIVGKRMFQNQPLQTEIDDLQTVVTQAKERRQELEKYSLSVLPTLLKGMIEDDVPSVRSICAWAVMWISSEQFLSICPKQIPISEPNPL